MKPEFGDKYGTQLASHVGARDGFALELYELSSSEVIAEVFHDDETRELSFGWFGDNEIPLDLAEWFLAKARDVNLGAHLHK